jgi:3-keto-5-aminohexanoate cleavage enzyme
MSAQQGQQAVSAGVVLTAAIVGAEVTRAQTPHVPYSAQEIAREAKRCADAGAAIVHLHVRNPDGSPSQDEKLFREAITAIRACTDVVVQVSTGGAVGMSIEERLGGLACDPEMATLNCGSVNFGDDVFLNPWPVMREIAQRIANTHAVPELELYEVGHLDAAMRLVKEGLVKAPLWIQLVLGINGAIGARESVLRFLVSELPEQAHWGVAGVGRHQFPMAALALELGGHVRVGLEDNIYLEKGVLSEGSAPLVEKAARLARERGREPLSAANVRALLR